MSKSKPFWFLSKTVLTFKQIIILFLYHNREIFELVRAVAFPFLSSVPGRP